VRTSLQRLAEDGQSPWVHHLSREWIHDPVHGLPRLVRCGITGVVSHPAALATALAHTTAYDEQIRTSPADDTETLRRELVRDDARQACDLLLDSPLGDNPLDGWVAVEVDPGWSGDAAETVSRAQDLSDAVNRANLLVGIAAVGEGLTAIEEATARGLRVMATGVHSPRRYLDTAGAYRRGLLRFMDAGGDPRSVTSVASVPLSVLDEKADLRLRVMGRNSELIGTLGVATAKLVHAESLSVFSGAGWERLAARGATPQRCVWSGLTVIDGWQSELRYVEEVVGRDTAALLSPHTTEAFLARGRVRPTLDRHLPAARRVLAALVKAGVSPKLIAGMSEEERARRGTEAFHDVRAMIDDKRVALGAAR